MSPRFGSNFDGLPCSHTSLQSSNATQKFINAIQVNSHLKNVKLRNNSLTFCGFLNVFENLTCAKFAPSIQISSLFIYYSADTLFYGEEVENTDLVLLLSGLKSNVPIKRVECSGFKSPSLEGLMALFEILSFNKSLIDLDISPHFIDVEKECFVILLKVLLKLLLKQFHLYSHL
ncbi:hypothetical protein GEMRC1_000922 [Eukaryota sp. GEM-RC1]